MLVKPWGLATGWLAGWLAGWLVLKTSCQIWSVHITHKRKPDMELNQAPLAMIFAKMDVAGGGGSRPRGWVGR